MKTDRSYDVYVLLREDDGKWVLSARFKTMLEAAEYISRVRELIQATCEIRPTGPPN